MVKKYFDGVIPESDSLTDPDDLNLKEIVDSQVKATFEAMEKFDVTKATTSIFNIFTEANTYIQKVQPWAVAKQEDGQARLKTILRNLLEVIRIGSELFEPFAPIASRKVLDALNIEGNEFANLDNFNGLKAGQPLKDLGILFPRLDVQKELEELSTLA